MLRPSSAVGDNARGDDFERVYPLLLEFEKPNLETEHWRQLIGQLAWRPVVRASARALVRLTAISNFVGASPAFPQD
jgi:hypothetical protein